MIALTPEMTELLRVGAATSYGRICFPFEVKDHGRELVQLTAAGLLFWGENGETPIITDAGRKAVGGVPQPELMKAEFAEACR
jgi:hypothetical protein